jgi:hypothetical protein
VNTDVCRANRWDTESYPRVLDGTATRRRQRKPDAARTLVADFH